MDGRAYELDRPDDKRRFPNFAHGTAGIAFFLARLEQVTGRTAISGRQPGPGRSG